MDVCLQMQLKMVTGYNTPKDDSKNSEPFRKFDDTHLRMSALYHTPAITRLRVSTARGSRRLRRNLQGPRRTESPWRIRTDKPDSEGQPEKCRDDDVKVKRINSACQRRESSRESPESARINSASGRRESSRESPESARRATESSIPQNNKKVVKQTTILWQEFDDKVDALAAPKPVSTFNSRDWERKQRIMSEQKSDAIPLGEGNNEGSEIVQADSPKNRHRSGSEISLPDKPTTPKNLLFNKFSRNNEMDTPRDKHMSNRDGSEISRYTPDKPTTPKRVLFDQLSRNNELETSRDKPTTPTRLGSNQDLRKLVCTHHTHRLQSLPISPRNAWRYPKSPISKKRLPSLGPLPSLNNDGKTEAKIDGTHRKLSSESLTPIKPTHANTLKLY